MFYEMANLYSKKSFVNALKSLAGKGPVMLSFQNFTFFSVSPSPSSSSDDRRSVASTAFRAAYAVAEANAAARENYESRYSSFYIVGWKNIFLFTNESIFSVHSLNGLDFRNNNQQIFEIDFRRNEENLIAGEDEDGNNNDEDKIGESQLGHDVKDDEEEKDLDVEKMKSQGKKTSLDCRLKIIV